MRRLALPLIVAFLFLGASPALGQEDAAPGKTMIVLDASGSMWAQVDGQPKIEIARGALGDLLAGWEGTSGLGLIAYGHRRKGDCGDIEILVAPEQGGPGAVRRAVEGLNPKGKTPLSEAVRRAAEQLRHVEEPASVILISDGRESCDADPCAVGAELERTGVDFTAHVIGFDVAGEEQAGLRCLAENTGGRFFAADQAESLNEALSQAAEQVRADYDHTILLDSQDLPRQTDYSIEVTGSLEQVSDSVAGRSVSENSGQDQVEGTAVRGQVSSFRDGYHVTGEISSIDLDDARGALVYVDGELYATEEHTVVIDGSGSGGSTGYTLRTTGPVEAVDGTLSGRSVAAEPGDSVSGPDAGGRVADDADGYRVGGGIVAVELEDPSAATVYVDGRPRHTVVVAGSEGSGGTSYEIRVDGVAEQVEGELAGFGVSGGDRAGEGGASGRVGGGNDGFVVYGEITSIDLDDAEGARVYVDGEPYATERHTVVIDGAGASGSTGYTIETPGAIEAVDGTLGDWQVAPEADDEAGDGTAEGRVAGDADGYRVGGGIASIELEDPSAATVYVDGRPRHTVVVAGRQGSGGTSYEIRVDGVAEQVSDELAGFGVSGGDRAGEGGASGRVGGGNDGFVVYGEITSIELDDAAAARVYVDGEPYATEEHTVVIDGSGSTGSTGYTIEATGEMETVDGTVGDWQVAPEADDEVGDGTAEGRVGGDADGYRVLGGIGAIELEDPSAATVYVDGRPYHTVVIAGIRGSGGTSYEIRVDGEAEQVDDELAGFGVSGGDRAGEGGASGRVGGGNDGFVIYGEILSIELEDPSAAHVYVDGQRR